MSTHATGAQSTRRPRRARFSGRTRPEGEPLSLDESGNPETPPAAGVGAATPDSAPVPGQQPTPPQDTDLRVDELNLGVAPGRLTRLLGKRLYAKLGPSATYVQRWLTFLFTSPGRLTSVALILVTAILLAGLSMWQTTSTRQSQLAQISELSEPMAHAAQNLYSSLTIADAAANTAFSRGTLTSNQDFGQDFDDAIAQAALAATRAATGISDTNDPALAEVATVQQLLPVYTGLVESARVNARQGHPVSVAYLATASGLMREEILPAAQSLYIRASTTNEARQSALALPPFFPMSGLLAAVIMLLAAQMWLARRSGRLFNVGLFGATLLMSTALVGVGVATTQPLQSSSLFGSNNPDVLSLTEVRIKAQQLRASETLGLVRRQPADDQTFAQGIDEIRSDLVLMREVTPVNGVDVALASLKGWEERHNRMVDRLGSGDYAGAVKVATGDTPLTSQSAFQSLDNALQKTIAESRLQVRQDLDESRRASAAISIVTVILTIIAAIMVAFGFRHPLMEYL